MTAPLTVCEESDRVDEQLAWWLAQGWTPAECLVALGDAIDLANQRRPVRWQNVADALRFELRCLSGRVERAA